MKRLEQPEQVAKGAFFLAPSDPAYTTGVEVNVDGEMEQF